MKKHRRVLRWALPATGVAALAIGGVLGENLIRPPRVDAACCYFAAKDKDINQPGQKAFINWNPTDKVEAFTVQPKFEGNAVDFGMVIPTPARPKLDEMPRDFFKDMAIYTILMPLPQMIWLDHWGRDKDGARPCCAAPDVLQTAQKERKVTVLEAGVVGSLDYKIIVAEDANGLFDWLKENQYAYAGDNATLKFYIDKKWFFTVMKIDPKQMKHNDDGSYAGEVTPTRFTFNSEKCIYPLKITQLSVKDKTDALFYVQAPEQMDLPDDWSWQHSYRTMYLSYMLGCSANPEQQKELQERQQWIAAKMAKDHKYETTKLEWAKKLTEAELSVLEDPLKNYGQMGIGDLPAGAKTLALDDFLKEAKAEFESSKVDAAYAKQQLTLFGDQYQASMGTIVKNEKPAGFASKYMWYPNRTAPDAEVRGLTRLKGHLQKGQWLTKFRKVLRKDEMTDDMVMVSVPKEQEQTYVRIMPTSPP
jgi:hypothetical protein